MKAINLILTIILILTGLLCGCSKKNKTEGQQPQTNKETIDAENIPEDADPKLKKAIEKTLESASGERRSRED